MHIDDLCRRDGFVTTASLAQALGISRQAAHRQLAAAVLAGDLVVEGNARARRYLPVEPVLEFAIDGAAEDELLGRVRKLQAAAFAELSRDEDAVLADVFIEMVNNAIDHSHGARGTARVAITDAQLQLAIEDDGIGAFESIRACCGLADHVEAAAEITKGKVTSMPQQHTGEGVFFTSKVVDRFELAANGIALVIDNDIGDYTIRAIGSQPGTAVPMHVRRPPARTMEQVFAEWTDEFEFTKTRTIVKLFALGRDFVSRSEARRLLQGLETFREVVVDFAGVDGIGQGFADEVFRVFASQHPETRLVPINMIDPVRFFVERAERARVGDA